MITAEERFNLFVDMLEFNDKALKARILIEGGEENTQFIDRDIIAEVVAMNKKDFYKKVTHEYIKPVSRAVDFMLSELTYWKPEYIYYIHTEDDNLNYDISRHIVRVIRDYKE